MEETRTIRRSMEEITASARMNMQDMIHRAIGLGQDCIDAKEQLGHGQFLPWLKELGLSSSTASNYMRVAREIAPGSRLAGLGYSKALALLSAPAEDREALAEETEGQSAAEIRKLIEERNRAAEAANAETARANQAEQEVKRTEQEAKMAAEKAEQFFNDVKASLKTQISTLESRVHVAEQNVKDLLGENQDLKEANAMLAADLLTAENNRVEVEKVVEKVPEDYERIKKQLENAKRSADDLIEAAAAAEERAAAAEAELEAARTSGAGQLEKDPIWKVIRMAVRRFEMDINPVWMASPAELARDQKQITTDLDMIRTCVTAIESLLQKQLQADGGAVIIE